MRLVEREMPLDPAVEPVDPDLADLADLALELRSQRPEPTAEADAKLDLLAEAGFPPRTSDRLGRLRRRVSDAARPAREHGTRRLLPALGVASVFVVAISVGVSQSGVLRGGDNPPQTASSRP